MRNSKKNSLSREIWKRFTKNKAALIAMCFLALLLFLTVFADVFWDYETDAIGIKTAEKLQSPNAKHIFGTDLYGRDVFVRVVYGARVSLLIGFGATVFSLIIAVILGATAAYAGGMVDNIIMRIIDVIMSIPSILLVLAIVACMGSGVPQLIFALAIGNLAGFTRVFRSSVLTIVGQEYIEAAKAMGGRNFYIIRKHIINNIVGIILVQFTMSISGNLLLGAALSFLGLGAQIPTPEWGTMLSEGMQFMRNNGYLVTVPGAVLALTALSINLIGDGLRDALDPRQKGRS